MAVHAEQSVVFNYDPCQHGADYVARGVAAAQHDIGNGKLRLIVYYGAAPGDTPPGDKHEAQVRARLLRERGIEAEVRYGSDVHDCAYAPYVDAYQEQMVKAVKAKYGARIWSDIDRDTRKLVKHRLIHPMAESH